MDKERNERDKVAKEGGCGEWKEESRRVADTPCLSSSLQRLSIRDSLNR